ncbi:hypothetical protein C8R43DRAFT_1112351 [Mycena crocata]|nr:hypothetical protein C8R43DRAFT_1112351 [Mycena crocata]
MQAWPLLDRRRVAPPPKVHLIVGSPANKVLRMHVVLVGRSLAPLVKFPFDFWCSREQSYATQLTTLPQSSTVNNNLLDTISVPAVRSAGPPTSIIYFAFSSPGFKSALNPVALSFHARVFDAFFELTKLPQAFPAPCAGLPHQIPVFAFPRAGLHVSTTGATTSASSRSSAARSAAGNLNYIFRVPANRVPSSILPPSASIPSIPGAANRPAVSNSIFRVPVNKVTSPCVTQVALHLQLKSSCSRERGYTFIYLKFVETFRRTLSGIHFNYFCVPLRVFARVELNPSNDMFNEVKNALLLEFQVQKDCRSQLRRINTPYQLKTSTFYFNYGP